MNGTPLTRTGLWTAAVLLSASMFATGCKSPATTPVQNAPGAVTNANGSVTVPAQSVAPAPTQAAPQQFAVRNPDGSITNPDGSVTYPAGSKVAVKENNPSVPSTITPAPVERTYNTAPVRIPAAAPVVRSAAAAGSAVVVRTNGAISAHDSSVGSRWTGSLVRPLGTYPAGTSVSGEVVASKGVGRFAGAGDLGIIVTEIGRSSVQTSEYEKARKGRGKRSAAFTGGGAGLGALIGGLAGGGKGALIGGLAGAGAGAGAGSFTGNTDVIIPAESVITFRLTNSLR